jgi:diaminopimelate decarboxylase
MRADLPEAVAAAIARSDGPTLVFDLATIERNLRAFSVPGVTTLFAAKSFPHPAVWSAAARLVDGFDAASAGELAALPPARVVSIADPSGRTTAHAPRADRVIVSCETVEQVRAAPAHAAIALRLSASLVPGDPAIGAVRSGDGHHRSRFGLDVAGALRELARAAAGRPIGLHVHHGPLAAASGERFALTARTALAAAREAGLAPAFLNLGGAWHAVPEPRAALAAVRAAVPPSIELLIEPGRAIAAGAGFACGAIVAHRALDDRALWVSELSRICHLRWSPVELVGTAPPPGTARPAIVVGPTCFEDDVLGDWLVGPDHLSVGARLVLRGVTGYAVAWNTGFAGIAPARVVIA